MDRVAAELGMDPIDVAITNDGAKGHDMEWLTERKEEAGFTRRDSLKECLEKGKAAIGLGQQMASAGRKETAQRQNARYRFYLDP